MPVAAHIDPDSRIVTFRCSGHVAIAEARRAFDQMMTDPALRLGSSSLWDLRSALIAGRVHAIPDILDMVHTRHPEKSGGCRVAILVAEEHDAVATMIETGSNAAHDNVRVFSSYVNAARWLGGEDV